MFIANDADAATGIICRTIERMLKRLREKACLLEAEQGDPEDGLRTNEMN